MDFAEQAKQLLEQEEHSDGSRFQSIFFIQRAQVLASLAIAQELQGIKNALYSGESGDGIGNSLQKLAENNDGWS